MDIIPSVPPLGLSAQYGVDAFGAQHEGVKARAEQAGNGRIADIEPTQMRSFYVRYGDWFSALCLACCLVLAAIGWKRKRDLRKVIETGS